MALKKKKKKAKRSDAIQKKKVITPEFRVAFPHVFEANAFGDQEAKFSLTMLFPKTTDLSKPATKDTNSLRKAAFNAAREKWGEDKDDWPKLRWPWSDGDKKEDLDGFAGSIVVKASSKEDNPPGVVNEEVEKIENKRDFYAGCWARAELIAFAYSAKGNNGVSFALMNVQKTRDGNSFSGNKKAEEVFERVDNGSDDEDNYDDDDDDDDDAKAGEFD